MERDRPSSVPPWLPLASWGFWLTVAAAVVAFFLQTLAAHRAEASAGARDWHLRVNICKRFSETPRPLWWECHARAEEDGDLVGPRTLDDQLR